LLGQQSGYGGVLSVGRVQTPTLKLVVDRDRAIASFVAVPYWDIELVLGHDGQSFKANWAPPDGSTDDAGRCLQEAVAQHTAAALRQTRESTVTHVKTERMREAPP